VITTARELNVLRTVFKALHADAAALLKDALHLRSTLKLMVQRKPLLVLEGRLDDLFERFVTLDTEFVEHTMPSEDINSATRLAAHLSVYRALRDSVSGLLTDTSDALGALRSRLDTKLSVILGVAAVVIALVAIVLDFDAMMRERQLTYDQLLRLSK
jgi:hypothetical protein